MHPELLVHVNVALSCGFCKCRRMQGSCGLFEEALTERCTCSPIHFHELSDSLKDQRAVMHLISGLYTKGVRLQYFFLDVFSE